MVTLFMDHYNNENMKVLLQRPTHCLYSKSQDRSSKRPRLRIGLLRSPAWSPLRLWSPRRIRSGSMFREWGKKALRQSRYRRGAHRLLL
jgi:hypothetical protein